MQVEIFSDVACPWCGIGKRRFEAALAAFDHADEVAVRWRSFELDPTAPAEQPGHYVDRLAGKYGTSTDEAQAMIDRMVDTAAIDGWAFDFDRIRPGNTFDAHRLLHLAAELDRQHAVKEALLSAYLEHGLPVGNPAALAEVAVTGGLPADDVADVLGSDRYATEVRADEQRARALGITGVPFFVLDNRFGVSGAQPADLLLETLQKAWAERGQLLWVGAAPHDHTPGDDCADGSCAI